jgi:hypothetical protein
VRTLLAIYSATAMKPAIERHLSPVMIVRWPAELSSDEVREHFEQVRAILHEGRHAFVIDMRAAGPASASLRKLAASDLGALFSEFGRTNIAGVAHVIDSPVVQGLLTAAYWFVPPPFPTLNTRDPGQAVRWAEDLLQPRAD